MANSKKKALSYSEWEDEIFNRLIDVGYKTKDALTMCKNYRGLYTSEQVYEKPNDVINRIMSKGSNVYFLDEDKIRDWQKETGKESPVTFVAYVR